MKRNIINLLVLSILLINPFLSKADEGMWLLSLLNKNYEEMKAKGFKLSPEDIYDVNKGCLKDAVVGLGNDGNPFRHFCSGEIISDQGLILTNHHCGFGKIQAHSSIEHDYLQDGFWAFSKEEELTNEGLTASILVRIEDVSVQILKELSDVMTEKERSEKIAAISKEISAKAVEGTHYNAYVADMFNNNQFFVFVYVIYKDVRLVGAPPQSMGKFGGDTDNWMWPRHTDDFSMFRIYTAPDGSPASYTKENIPLKPKHFFPVSIKGIENGDFAMIMGFPGTTERYITSYGLTETMNIQNKLRFEIRDVKINVLRAEMASNQAIRIKYASKYASCSNYWKYSKQQNIALKQLNTLGVKQNIENNYLTWAKGKDKKYTEALPIIEKVYYERAPYFTAFMFLSEGLLSGTELPLMTYRNSSLIDALKANDAEKTNKLIEKIKSNAVAFYKDYNPETEKKLMKAMFSYVNKNIDKTYLPDIYNIINKKYKGNIDKFVDDIFAKSIFVSEEKLNAFLDKPNVKTLENDLLMITGISIYTKYKEVYNLYNQNSEELSRGERIFTDGILQMNPTKIFAPDANSTIRLTYGNVGKYDPRDGVEYNYFTTLNGVMQKEDPSNSEFIVSVKLKELYSQKDFGQYADKTGELPTCFITNNDITGGNSGSPVINANGELIGIAFDGNSEAMSGDIDFEENLQRCINVDIRYVLFTIDKFAGAKNLIQEMKIVK
ncbi:MAG: S46 family peptidase [Bacteroidales bacterium]|jgi:hypothetical protein|nr:S46 family peptidase [Bacteroidales bacterium]